MSERDYMRRDSEGGPRPSFWATYPGTKALLIGLLCIQFLSALLRRASPETWQSLWNVLALHPEFVLQRFWVWQIVTGGLLHVDFWHLFWNCFAIYFFGRIVEQRVGIRRFLVFALGGTICAALAYLLWAVLIDSVAPALGASGAAMGMIALAALWYPRMTIMLFAVFPIQLWVLAAVLVLFDLFGALESGPGGVAHSAHLGGALYGWIYYRFGGRIEHMFGAIDRYAERQRRKKERRRRARAEQMRAELDRILDKVNREGMAALSDQERRFLKDASDRLRR